MKNRVNLTLLKQDMKTAIPTGVLLALYIGIANMIFGRICPARFLFGIPCPGCGITRTFLLLAQGKLIQASKMHIFWIPMVVLVIAFLIVRYLVFDKEKNILYMKIIKKITYVMLVLSIVYYLYRMIVYFPNQEPMIYEANNLFNVIRAVFNL